MLHLSVFRFLGYFTVTPKATLKTLNMMLPPPRFTLEMVISTVGFRQMQHILARPKRLMHVSSDHPSGNVPENESENHHFLWQTLYVISYDAPLLHEAQLCRVSTLWLFSELLQCEIPLGYWSLLWLTLFTQSLIFGGFSFKASHGCAICFPFF